MTFGQGRLSDHKNFECLKRSYGALRKKSGAIYSEVPYSRIPVMVVGAQVEYSESVVVKTRDHCR